MKQKNNTLLYLFGNEENLKFICRQIVPELDDIVDQSTLFCRENVNPLKRLNNYRRLYVRVNSFFERNQIFNAFINNYCDAPLKRVIEAYVYVKIKSDRKNYFLNIYTDERSIVYNGIDLDRL